ncbi:MAG: carbohydrate ABC transporter permease [Ruminococcus sp.]
MKISYQKRKSMYGYGFIALWLAGAVLFFLIPLVESFMYSFQDISPASGSMKGSFAGLAKYDYALNADPNYRSYLVSVLVTALWKTPLIMVFSLFAAVILNQKFKGRTFARAVFFLPVIIATGPVFNIINGNMISTGNGDPGGFSALFRTDLLSELMTFLGIYDISEGVTAAAETIANSIFSIVWNAGIQILIFLAALRNIPESSKEAARIEGASEWDCFWKITLPGVSPMILVCFIYTVIDTFTDPGNAVMGRISDMQADWKYGEASAMAWIYFVIVLAAAGIVSFVINKFVYYETD